LVIQERLIERKQRRNRIGRCKKIKQGGDRFE